MIFRNRKKLLANRNSQTKAQVLLYKNREDNTLRSDGIFAIVLHSEYEPATKHKTEKNSLVKFYSYLNSIFYISELEILFLCIEKFH